MTLEGLILGKFFCPGCERHTADTDSAPVTKTWGVPKGAVYLGGGRAVADA
jgi:hypothetical protein